MIHYHGTPIGGNHISAAKFLSGRHAFVSFARPDQITIVKNVCQSFAVDNGSFTTWKQGKTFSPDKYYNFIEKHKSHPAFDFAVIPDLIDGSEKDNNTMLYDWPFKNYIGVPVWHMHESLSRLRKLAELYPKIAIGSSSQFKTPGTNLWNIRIKEAFNMITEEGEVICKVHGLRMLDPKIFTRFPFSSCDSTNVGRNVTNKKKWKSMESLSDHVKATIIADRIESYQSGINIEL